MDPPQVSTTRTKINSNVHMSTRYCVDSQIRIPFHPSTGKSPADSAYRSISHHLRRIDARQLSSTIGKTLHMGSHHPQGSYTHNFRTLSICPASWLFWVDSSRNWIHHLPLVCWDVWKRMFHWTWIPTCFQCEERFRDIVRVCAYVHLPGNGLIPREKEF